MEKTNTIYAMVKITYKNDSNPNSYWADLTEMQREQIALSLAVQPNFNTVECGVSLESVEVQMRDEDSKSVDEYNMCNPDITFSK